MLYFVYILLYFFSQMELLENICGGLRMVPEINFIISSGSTSAVDPGSALCC